MLFIFHQDMQCVKALTKDMKLIVLSTTTLKKSLKDDFRFPKEFWRI